MTAGNIQAAFRLTPLQEGMLYESLRNPGTAIYQGLCTAVLEGPLDLECFREAWSRAAARHEAFRTFFAWEKRDAPVQVVRGQVELDVPLVDWTAGSEEERREWWADLLRWRPERSIGLDRAPMARLQLIRLSEERHRLVWRIHHAVLDGWSAFLVLREVMEDYAALVVGEDPMRPLPPSYGQFVAWLEQRAGGAAEAYWRRTLAGFTDPTPLPVSRTPDGPDAGGRATEVSRLSADETQRLRERARTLRVTLATLVSAAWAVVLARHARRTEVVFGVTVSERPPEIPGVERAAGLYLNTVPVCVRVPDEGDLADWLLELQSTLAEGREHSAPGLVAIRRWSALEEGRLFESFPPEIQTPTNAEGLTLTDATVTGPSDLPLALLAFPGETLELHLERATDRVDAGQARALLDQVRSALEAMVESHPAAPGRLRLLSRTQRRHTVDAWASGASADAAYPDVLGRVRAVAATAPDRTAVYAPDGAFTYGELLSEVDRAARALREIQPVWLAGVEAERSRWFPVGVLASLAADVPYVVVDPAEPEVRRARRLQGVGARFVDGRWSVGGGGASEPLDPAAAMLLADAAYVVYTSGSTGHPKGVVVGRAELAWSTGVRDAVYGSPPGAFLLLSPLTVDSAVAGFWWTLSTGGTLVLPPERIEQDPAAFTRLLAERGVTHTLLVPSLYGTLLNVLEPAAWSGMKGVIVAGEACPPGLPLLHRFLLPQASLHNEYGPSETTVWATVADLGTEGDVTIGRPIPGARVYVLDERMEPVPPGLPGELYVGGRGVARGYLGLAAETAERFVQDPFTEGRLYRTGDRVEWTPDGRLRFLGRVDTQVKIRGHRIELEEVERVLRTHPGILDAAVSVVEPGRDLDLVGPMDVAGATDLAGPTDPIDPRNSIDPKDPLDPSDLVEALARLPATVAEALLDRAAGAP